MQESKQVSLELKAQKHRATNIVPTLELNA